MIMNNEKESILETVDNYLNQGKHKIALIFLTNPIVIKNLKISDLEKYIKEDGINRFSIDEKIAILEAYLEDELKELPDFKDIASLLIHMTIGLEIESVGKYYWLLKNRNIGEWIPKKEKNIVDEKHNYGGVEYIHSKFNRRGSKINF